jgi:hypothetical protein
MSSGAPADERSDHVSGEPTSTWRGEDVADTDAETAAAPDARGRALLPACASTSRRTPTAPGDDAEEAGAGTVNDATGSLGGAPAPWSTSASPPVVTTAVSTVSSRNRALDDT